MNSTKVRTDLKCLSIGSVWQMLKKLSECQGLSASGYVRQMVIKEFKKERNKESVEA